MEQDIFISYSHLDADKADAVCERLEREGIGCWYAPRNIGPGEEWASAIMKALDACRIMVLIFTDASSASVQVLREVGSAVSSGKTVIPFKFTENDPEGAMDYYLSTLHWLDASNMPMDEALDTLYERIRAILDSKEETPSVSPKKKKKTRKRLRLDRTALLRILGMLPTLFAFFTMAACFIGSSAYRNGTTAAFIGFAVLFLVILFFQLMKLLGKKITKRPGLVCLGACIGVVAVSGVVIGVLEGRSRPYTFDDNGQEISQNTTNYSFAVRSDDGTVYYCGIGEDMYPCISCAPYEDFIAGYPGTELVKRVWADNLVLLDDRRLVFRDHSTSFYKMKMLDLDTGEITVLRRKSGYSFYAAGSSVFYGEESRVDRGLGVISLESGYDGTSREMNIYNFRICYYKGDLYYLNEDGYLTRDSDGRIISRDVNDHFLIYDDTVFFQGSSGGLYRLDLSDGSSPERLTRYTPHGMVVYDGYVYFLSEEDDWSLYRVPVGGGDADRMIEHEFTAINVIGDYLYLCDASSTCYLVDPYDYL